MTTTQTIRPDRDYATCPVTGQRYVRKITFLDSATTEPHHAPIHVPARILFDDEEVTGVRFAPAVEVQINNRDATRVVLYVDAEDCTPPFRTTDEPPAPGWIPHAPPSIGGHVFMVPVNTPWDLVELDGDEANHPWGQNFPARRDEGGTTHWLEHDPQWVRCEVFVAEVEVR